MGATTPTQKRIARRARARARFRLHLHKKKIKRLSWQELFHCHRVLSTHHSADFQHLKKIQIEMADQEKAPWRCAYCNLLRSYKADVCDKCMYPWAQCWDPTYVHQPHKKKGHQTSSDAWNYQVHQQSWRKPSASPRARARPRPPRNRQQLPVEPAAGKGKGKVTFQPEPAWGGKGKSSKSAMPAPVQETPTPAAPEVTESDMQLRQIRLMLQKSEAALPSEVQQWLHSSAAASSQAATRQLHGAVTQLGLAKQTLTNARLARSQMHGAWRTFVNQSVARWQKNVQEFADEDAKLDKEIAEALAALKLARAHLESTKQTATAAGPSTDGGDISDEELAADPGPMIAEDMSMVLESLGQLKQKAEAALESDVNKKFKPSPALEVKTEAEMPALQPFGKPGL